MPADEPRWSHTGGTLKQNANLKSLKTRAERSPIKHLHTVRQLLRFAKTRAGYRAS
jgi:hypothetical protein